MQRIKIASIEVKEGDNSRGHWQNFIITGEDTAKVSTFDAAASSLKAGDTIEADIELKGKYANIKSFKLIEHSAPSLKAELPLTGSDARAESIEQQVAVKVIVELRIAEKLLETSPEYKAMLAWCRDRLSVKILAKSPQVASSTPDDATSSPIKEESKGILPAKDKLVEMVGKIDKAWLIESINKLKWDILKYIKDTYRITGTAKESLFGVITKLSDEQQGALVKEIEDRLGML